MKILFVDSCTKEGEDSRTRMLCRVFLEKTLAAHPDYQVETIVLKDMDLKPYRQEDAQARAELIEKGKLDHPMLALAGQFAGADRILIGAPFWDLCFPSLLKIYIEHIFATGVTFRYDGPRAVGMCRAEKLMYIQSAGGFTGENDPGTVYMKAICEMLGIPKFERICAEGIDIQEIPTQPQIQKALDEIERLAPLW